MNSKMEQLLDAVLALPDGDRVEFVEALMASFSPTTDRLSMSLDVKSFGGGPLSCPVVA